MKVRSSRATRRACCLAVGATLLTVVPAFAQTAATWVSPGDGTWSNPTNWSTNPVAPDNGSPAFSSRYDVTIPTNTGGTSSPRVWLYSDTSLDSLAVNASASLYQYAGTLRPGNLIVAGSYHFDGGILAGGTLSTAGTGQIYFSVTPVTIDGTSLQTNLGVPGYAALTLLNPQPLTNHNLYIGSSFSSTTTSVTVAGSLTGTGAVAFYGAGLSKPHSLVFSSLNPSIGPNITVRTGDGFGSLTSTAGPIVNFGTLSALTQYTGLSVPSALDNRALIQASNGSTLTLPNLTNNGTVSVSANSNLNLAGVNNGTIALTDSTLRIVGPLTGNPITLTNSNADLAVPLATADVLALPIMGPLRIANKGVIDNTNAALLLSAASPQLLLAGGTITGGTIASSDGTAVATLYGGYRSTLSSLTLATPLVINSNSTVAIDRVSNQSTITVNPGGHLALSTLPSSLGNLSVAPGGYVDIGDRLPSAVAYLDLPPTATTVSTLPSIQNTGATLSFPNAWGISGTTIHGGTIAGPGRLVVPTASGATLDSVTLATDLDVHPTYLTIPNSLTLSNATVRLFNEGSAGGILLFNVGGPLTVPQSINGTGVISFEGTSTVTTPGSVVAQI